MKIKILTHRIRLNDGHVMPDWMDVPASNSMEKEASEIKESIRNGDYDTKDYAIRMRRSPKSRHAIDVNLDVENFIGYPVGFW
jgi:hypothetical protein